MNVLLLVRSYLNVFICGVVVVNKITMFLFTLLLLFVSNFNIYGMQDVFTGITRLPDKPILIKDGRIDEHRFSVLTDEQKFLIIKELYNQIKILKEQKTSSALSSALLDNFCSNNPSVLLGAEKPENQKLLIMKGLLAQIEQEKQKQDLLTIENRIVKIDKEMHERCDDLLAEIKDPQGPFHKVFISAIKNGLFCGCRILGLIASYGLYAFAAAISPVFLIFVLWSYVKWCGVFKFIAPLIFSKVTSMFEVCL
jgi:hypothetical protein